ncbi:NUDIX hydrolase [Peribacillus deserti]|uniref:DNA mismatch repair protein MutT n=1 Tax=Peribacillus deserti TaxID=673318 RepID=A0A2N5MB07_9BACI|nr:NUDIX hydrolase [Peribacillus deserti]PLT31534.1 DNA mismatch repair protein MutT [Peribacillus deserti]
MGYVEDLRAIVGTRPLILTGAVCVIVDEKGRFLLQERRFPKGSWGIPGGLMELGESAEETARREVYEETKLRVKDLKLINVYSGPESYIKAENGDEFYAVTIAYYTYNTEGTLMADTAESISFDYFYPDELPDTIVKSHRKVLNDYIHDHYTNGGFRINRPSD